MASLRLENTVGEGFVEITVDDQGNAHVEFLKILESPFGTRTFDVVSEVVVDKTDLNSLQGFLSNEFLRTFD